ncbi:Protein of unknown function [Pyronema omphalodes CBS 100304]|uniref:Uncharacterized protein n=1 Tax=Pyronema omphalodes (strain CBS 100304) TaxID=1076935 RepID=U4KW28_PYROM|nr:Protein of unknown function [Pyronema omphalodes CBS 100304]
MQCSGNSRVRRAIIRSRERKQARGLKIAPGMPMQC